MYLLLRILLVAGDKNAAQIDLSKKLSLKSPRLDKGSGRAESKGLNSSRLGLQYL